MATSATKAANVQLRVNDLMTEARTKTGLSDFGDSWFMEPLEALVHFVNTESGLASLDVPPVHHMVKMLANRLKLADYLKKHPKILDEKLNVVGIILGQARGGSTLTHRLISQSPQLTSTFFWELFNPVPMASEVRGQPTERRKIGDDEVASWRQHMPEYVGMHPLDSAFVEEDIWFLDRGFMSYLYNIHFNIPSYFDWVLTQDNTKAIAELRVWLQLLQYENPERRERKWLLKNQHHIMSNGLRLMFKMFPGAKAIQTHRRLEEALPSLASVQSVHIRTSGTTNFDRRELGDRLIHQYISAYTHMMEVHRDMPNAFIDLQYRDTATKPIEQYRKAIEGLGLVCGPADINAASDWMSKNHRGTHPPHDYTPEDFGLSREGLQKTFKFYHDAFLTT